MKTQETTQENVNKIIEFRQAIYANAFPKRRDALFETWDALTLSGEISSFPRLSLSPQFQRQWHSLYKALEKGQIDQMWLAEYLAKQVPQTGICHFALDGTVWPRPRGRTLDDR